VREKKVEKKRGERTGIVEEGEVEVEEAEAEGEAEVMEVTEGVMMRRKKTIQADQEAREEDRGEVKAEDREERRKDNISLKAAREVVKGMVKREDRETDPSMKMIVQEPPITTKEDIKTIIPPLVVIDQRAEIEIDRITITGIDRITTTVIDHRTLRTDPKVSGFANLILVESKEMLPLEVVG